MFPLLKNSKTRNTIPFIRINTMAKQYRHTLWISNKVIYQIYHYPQFFDWFFCSEFSNNLWTTPYLMHVMTSTNFLRLQAVLWVRLSENLGSSANILNRSRPCIPIWGRVWRILVWLEMSVLKRKFLVFQSQQSPLLVWIQSVHQQTRKKKSRIIIRSSKAGP